MREGCFEEETGCTRGLRGKMWSFVGCHAWLNNVGEKDQHSFLSFLAHNLYLMSHTKNCDIVQDLSDESGSVKALIAFSWCVPNVTEGFKPLFFVGQGRWDLEMSLTVPKGSACVPHRLCLVTHPTETPGAADGQEGPAPREVRNFPLSPRRSLSPYVPEKAPFPPFPLAGHGVPPARRAGGAQAGRASAGAAGGAAARSRPSLPHRRGPGRAAGAVLAAGGTESTESSRAPPAGRSPEPAARSPQPAGCRRSASASSARGTGECRSAGRAFSLPSSLFCPHVFPFFSSFPRSFLGFSSRRGGRGFRNRCGAGSGGAGGAERLHGPETPSCRGSWARTIAPRDAPVKENWKDMRLPHQPRCVSRLEPGDRTQRGPELQLSLCEPAAGPRQFRLKHSAVKRVVMLFVFLWRNRSAGFI